MTTAQSLEHYAKRTVGVGLNLQPGQRLAIDCMAEGRPVRAIAAQAYAAGTSFVDVLFSDQHLRRPHIEHRQADPAWSPPRLVKRLGGLGTTVAHSSGRPGTRTAGC